MLRLSKKATQEHLEKESGEGNVDGGLEEDGGNSSRQSWMDWSQRSVAHAALGATRHMASPELL